MDFQDLRVKLEEHMAPGDIKLVEKAFLKAEELHKNVRRASGEPYIIHPLTVASILSDLRLDPSTIIAAILHDTVEDTYYSVTDIRNEFSEEVAGLVDGVTKISDIKYKSVEEGDAEAVRKLLMASTKDLRVILIKIADKLHNMRTLHHLSEERQLRTARDCLNIYAPLAYRLGLASIKWELEDLSFKVIEPEIYQKFKLRFGKTRKDRENDIQEIKDLLNAKMQAHGLSATIVGRPKHFYSIYKKMLTKNRSFDEVNDLIALRVITSSVKECYEVLGIIHSLWPPIQGKFKDYIAMPKKNLYQSLHTAVVAKRQPVEFQIRTGEMHQVAEEGIAAHWKYKHLDENVVDKKLSWLRDILDYQQKSENTSEFMDFLKVDLFDDEVYVLTPKGEVVSLPKGSCTIDFAYKIHTSIGDRATGAIVNARMVPLRYELKTGEIVQILTSNTPGPKRDWLKFVKTTTAKSRIRHFLRERGEIPIQDTGGVLEIPVKDPSANLVLVDGVPDASVKLAKCCHPVPDDAIIAYPSSNFQYAIHKKNCENLVKKTSKNKTSYSARWNDSYADRVMLKVVAEDRLGVFADILNTVAAASVNIDPAKAKTIGQGNVECELGFIPDSMDQVRDVVSRVRQRVRGVKSVFLRIKN